MDRDYVELLQFLKEMGLENISKSEKKSLYARLKKGSSLAQVKSELHVLYSLNRVLINSYTDISISNMNKINKDIDANVLFQLLVIHERIKSKGLSNISTIREFKKACYGILSQNKTANIEIEHLAKTVMSHMQVLKDSLYLTMLNKDKADVLLANCYKRARLSMEKCQASNLESIIYCLKKNFSFSDEELIKVSSQCGTIFALSSAEKLMNLNKTLTEFKNYIKEQLTISNKAIDASKFLTRDFKDVLTTSATLAIADNTTLENVIRFFKGEKLGNFIKSENEDIANLKGNFTPAQLAKIYSKSITSIATSMGKIKEASEGIYNAYEKCFNGKISLDNFINGRNFVSLTGLRKEDYDSGKINEIFKLLSPFVSKENMQSLLENNFGFLKASVEDVKVGIQEAILESKNNDELQRNILRKIRGQFSRDVGTYVNAQREDSVIIDKKKQVKISNMEEEEIVSLLKVLKTNQQEIEAWKKDWNKENKEIRELEIQIDLEDLLSETESLKTMTSIDSFDTNTYAQELDIVLDLFNEIVSKHDAIIYDCKLNKRLKDIDNKIVANIEEVSKTLNKSIERLTKQYSIMLEGVTNDLKSIVSSKEKYLELQKRLEEKERELEEQNINDEEIERRKKEIDELSDFIEESNKKIKEIDLVEEQCNRKIDEFGELLLQRERTTMTNDPQRIINDRYSGAKYVFDLFVYILCRDDLIYPPDDLNMLDLDKEDENISYTQLMSILGPKDGKLIGEVYNGFLGNWKKSHEVFDKMCDKLQSYNRYDENIRTMKKAIIVLRKLHSDLSAKNIENCGKLRTKSALKDMIKEYDLEYLSAETTRLQKAIKEYNDNIKRWEDKKIK